MDNQFSQPSLELPTIPSDFESKAGTSKTDFLRATFELLAGAQIKGITEAQPTPYDLGAMQTQLNNIQKTVDALAQRKIRRVGMQAVNNGVVVVPFQDIGTDNYLVHVEFITPNENFDPIQWSIVEDSKTSKQVTLRIDGRAGAFHIDVTIISMDGI